MGAMIGEGHVFHARENGVDHQFRYPTFFLAIDCAREAQLRAELRTGGRFFLSLNARDYLAGRVGSFDEVARDFLKERCGYDAEEIWLQTLPRMFGYAFNPVSFWLCRRGGALDAVLVEVNNTFGERHFYWLDEAAKLRAGAWIEAPKAFHVSPFMPLDGYYRFRFQRDELRSKIDIHYHGPDGRLRLATWIHGDLRALAGVGGAGLLFRYGWMTPLVVFRIHAQAMILYFKKAKFFRKPPKASVEVTCSNDR